MSVAIETTTSNAPESIPNRWFSWGVFWLALLMAPVPMLVHYFAWNWQYKHYHFFPIVFVVVGWLAYQRSDHRFYAPRTWLGWLTIAIAIISLYSSLQLFTPWLAIVTFVLFGTVLLSSMRGPWDHSLLGLAIPLVLLIRLPLGYDQELIISLQSITTQLTSVLLDALRIPHSISGNVIQLASKELFVAEACSGIQSVFTLAFAGTVLIAVSRHRLWMTLINVIFACILAVGTNVLRVTTVATAEAWWGMDWASGWAHEVIGYIALGIGIGLLLSFDQLVLAFVHPIPESDDITAFNPFVWCWQRIATVDYACAGTYEESFVNRSSSFGALLGGVFASLALVSFGWSSVLAWNRSVPETTATGMYAATGPIFEPTKNMFDGEFEMLELNEYEVVRGGENPRLGENADVWSGTVAGRPVQLVVSQTYTRFHEFCFCYQINGWELLNREVYIPEGESQQSALATALFSHPSGGFGQLAYVGVSAAGKVIVPSYSIGRLTHRFGFQEQDTGDDQVVMLQLWMVGDEMLPNPIFQAIIKDVAKARDIVVQQLSQQWQRRSPASVETP